jgi:alginate O-acetyltransferase complex protein AlgI
MFLVLERLGFGRWLGARHAAIRHVYLLLVVMVGWVFFRADSLPRAFTILSALAGAGSDPALLPIGLFLDPRIALALLAGIVGSIPWLRALQAWSAERERGGRIGAAIALETVGLGLLLLVLVASSLELASNSYNPFIYFRF